MRAVVQRVSQASVSIDDQIVGQIGRGLVVLVGVKDGDTEADAHWLANKVANLRIFPDAQSKFNLSALEVGGEALVVSQFTLYGDARKGRRPDFTAAARPEIAEPLVTKFVGFLRDAGLKVATGKFQAMMLVKIFNDGPVTIILESKERA